MKKLFIVQYSQELDQFQLQEIDNPKEVPNFQVPIIDASHQSTIRLSSHLVDTEKEECSFPNAQVFANPHNDLSKGPKLGLLYNWFALSHPNFAPAGWHVPSTVEINSLVYESNRPSQRSFQFIRWLRNEISIQASWRDFIVRLKPTIINRPSFYLTKGQSSIFQEQFHSLLINAQFQY